MSHSIGLCVSPPHSDSLLHRHHITHSTVTHPYTDTTATLPLQQLTTFHSYTFNTAACDPTPTRSSRCRSTRTQRTRATGGSLGTHYTCVDEPLAIPGQPSEVLRVIQDTSTEAHGAASTRNSACPSYSRVVTGSHPKSSGALLFLAGDIFYPRGERGDF